MTILKDKRAYTHQAENVLTFIHFINEYLLAENCTFEYALRFEYILDERVDSRERFLQNGVSAQEKSSMYYYAFIHIAAIWRMCEEKERKTERCL